MKIDARTADRLIKICRLFSSNQVGERASAAAMADGFLKAHSLDWADVISVRAIGHAPNDTGNDIDFALQRKHLLNAWQRRFVASLCHWRGRLTPKQRAKLNEITAELRSSSERSAA